MAEFKLLDELKAELRDMAPEAQKERRKSVLRTANDLNDMVDEAIEVFVQLHPMEMKEFSARLDAKRMDATKYGEPVKATSDEKNMELRSELWFPSVKVVTKGAYGRTRVKYRDLKGVLAAIYRRHGFEDFPNAQNHTEFLMLKSFHERWGKLFAVASKL